MYIDEKTAQLILDAIGWCNIEWHDILDMKDQDEVSTARIDFLRFCEARGIVGVERTVESWIGSWVEDVV